LLRAGLQPTNSTALPYLWAAATTLLSASMRPGGAAADDKKVTSYKSGKVFNMDLNRIYWIQE
jgi:hypothetical protein